MLLRALGLVPRLAIFPIAASTPVVLAAQALGWSFSLTATLCAVSSIAVLTWLVRSEAGKTVPHASAEEMSAGMRLLVAGIISALVTFVINRPDADDYHYVPNVVYFLAHPEKAMDFDIHYLVSAKPIQSVSWGTSLTYEYFVGFISHFSGLDFLVLYHRVFPVVFAFAWPCAVFGLSQLFIQRPALAALGCVVMVVLVTGMGETHRTLGNLSLARFFQGKYIALSLGLPLFLDILAGSLLRPLRRHTIESSICSLGMIGLSASAAVLAASGALASGFAAALFASVREKSRMFFSIVIVAAAPVGYLLVLRYVFPAGMQETHVINAGWPADLGGQLAFFWNAACPFTPLVALISCLSLPCVAKNRRFLVLWFVFIFILLLTPLPARLIIAHLSGPNIYWRLLYLLPFPLLIVVGVEQLGTWLERRWKNGPMDFVKQWAVVVAAGLAVLASPGSSIFRPANAGVGFNLSPQLPAGPLKVAKAIVSMSPKGPMVAPSEIAGIVAMLSADFPQVRIRDDAMLFWFGPASDNSGTIRIAGSNFLDGKAGAAPTGLFAILERFPDLENIVARTSVVTPSLTLELAGKWGFVHQKRVTDEFVVFSKSS